MQLPSEYAPAHGVYVRHSHPKAFRTVAVSRSGARVGRLGGRPENTMTNRDNTNIFSGGHSKNTERCLGQGLGV